MTAPRNITLTARVSSLTPRKFFTSRAAQSQYAYIDVTSQDWSIEGEQWAYALGKSVDTPPPDDQWHAIPPGDVIQTEGSLTAQLRFLVGNEGITPDAGTWIVWLDATDHPERVVFPIRNAPIVTDGPPLVPIPVPEITFVRYPGGRLRISGAGPVVNGRIPLHGTGFTTDGERIHLLNGTDSDTADVTFTLLPGGRIHLFGVGPVVNGRIPLSGTGFTSDGARIHLQQSA